MIWFVAVLVVLIGLVAVLNAIFPGVLNNEDSQISLTHSILLLTLLSGSAILGYRGRGRAAVKHALAWAGIALVLVLAYSFRDDLGSVGSRLGGALLPSRPIVNANGEVELRAAANGHFQADASVNGVKVRLMVDTGASRLALAPDDAARIGIDLDALSYDTPVSTANGLTYVANVRLDEVDIGGISVRGLSATVQRDGLDQSLLGMNFLDRLHGFERRGDRLILRP